MVFFVVRTGTEGCTEEDWAVSGIYDRLIACLDMLECQRPPNNHISLSGCEMTVITVETRHYHHTTVGVWNDCHHSGDSSLTPHHCLGVKWQSSQWRPVTSTTPLSVWVWNDSHHSGDPSLPPHHCLFGYEMTVITVETRQKHHTTVWVWNDSHHSGDPSLPPHHCLSGCEMTVIAVETRQ